MRRRRLLQSMLAAPVMASTASSALAQSAAKDTLQVAATPAESVAELPIRFFTTEQFATLQLLCDTIMPAADGRPGARQAETAEFLDFLISQSPPDRQHLYRDGLDQLGSQDFMNGKAGTALAPLNAPWTYNGPADRYAKFLIAAKGDIIEATLNSREWSASSNNRARAGTSYYWLPME